MMRKAFLLFIAVVLLGVWAKDFVHGGGLEKFLDAHPNQQVNPVIEYYWGMLLSLANHFPAAEYRFRRVRDKYADSAYAPLAWAELVNDLDEAGDRNAVVSEGNSFLEKYADHPKADIVKRKLSFLKNGF